MYIYTYTYIYIQTIRFAYFSAGHLPTFIHSDIRGGNDSIAVKLCHMPYSLHTHKQRIVDSQRENLEPAQTQHTSCLHSMMAESHVVCCSVLQCVAVCCSVLQCVAVCDRQSYLLQYNDFLCCTLAA